MDANTPINIPIRLEQWIHDNYMEVETIIIDARPILDATDFDNLPRMGGLGRGLHRGERSKNWTAENVVWAIHCRTIQL